MAGKSVIEFLASFSSLAFLPLCSRRERIQVSQFILLSTKLSPFYVCRLRDRLYSRCMFKESVRCQSITVEHKQSR